MSSGSSTEWTDADVDAYLEPEHPSDTTCEHGLDYEHYLDPETDRRICHPPNCSACVPAVIERDVKTFPATWAGFRDFLNVNYPRNVFPEDDTDLGPQFVRAARRIAELHADLSECFQQAALGHRESVAAILALHGKVNAAEERAGVAEQALTAIAAMHKRSGIIGDDGDFCVCCEFEWPCPTFTAANSVVAAGSTPTTTQEADNG